jgi:hypothetical protein
MGAGATARAPAPLPVTSYRLPVSYSSFTTQTFSSGRTSE